VTGTGAPDDRWEGDAIAAWQRRWNVPALRVLAMAASTNDEARVLAQAGAPAGTVVIADHQSAGRGREGRRWHDTPGESLLLSVVLRPARSADPASPGPAPLRVGLAACDAIRRVTGIETRLKWPNDVLTSDDRKLAGILCEAVSGADPFVVAGVGINVLQSDAAWPPELAGRVTSIRAVAGAAPTRAALAAALIDALRPFTPGTAELDAAELDAFRRRDALDGREIALDGEPAGTAAGIGADGALIIRTPAGTRTVHSGTVRPVRQSYIETRDREHSTSATRPRP
jgi:BirA family biotin operon repressor/biotin-[acetyl-CoA-carboxylase] ligase